MTERAAHPSRRPNLIVFLPDQQRTDTIACYGNNKVHAPNLARLASESTIFERAYVTQPVCTPSRSSLLTGTWPHTNGCTRNSVPLPSNVRAFPELLEKSEYHTGYFGKWHLGSDNVAQRGFQEWISTEDTSDYSQFLLEKGARPDKANDSFSPLAISELPFELSKPRFVSEHACSFIEKHARDPFILFVAFAEPHSPYNGPFNREHDLDEIDLDPTALSPPNDNVPLRYRLMREWQQAEALLDRTRRSDLFFFGITPEENLRIKQRYLGLVTLVDHCIGSILGCLERFDLIDDTIVVHTSDHGDMLGAHHLYAKEVMFENAVRVPYLVHLPGQRQSRRISQPVSHIDFIPTLIDLLGFPPASQCAGKSRLPLIQGESMPDENVFIEWAPNRTKIKKGSALASRRMIRRAVEESTRTIISSDGWKLSLRDKDLNELYNLKSDPQETQNLYSDNRHEDVVARLADEVEDWQTSVGDNLNWKL